MAFTFVDLFAGIGGFRLGLQTLGGECVFSCEIDKFARHTYRINFEPVDHDDIRTLEAKEIPDADLWAAGFPCQPFSLAGVSKKASLGLGHGLKDKRQGLLFWRLASLIRERHPATVILENVRNLLTHDSGRTYRLIKERLEYEGYGVTEKLISCRPWVPQRRTRLFIVATLGVDPAAIPDTPMGTDGPDLRSILETNPEDEFTITDRLWEYLPAYAAKHRSRGNGFGYELADLSATARTLSARYHKDGAEILIPQPGRNPRRLTPRECARLMGFPDTFRIEVSNTQAYRQFGNAVVPEAVTHVARSYVPADADAEPERGSVVPPSVAALV